MCSVFGKIFPKETLMVEIEQKLQKLVQIEEEKQKAAKDLEEIKNRNVLLKQAIGTSYKSMIHLKFRKAQKEENLYFLLKKELQEEKKKTEIALIEGDFAENEKDNLEYLNEEMDRKIFALESKCFDLELVPTTLEMMQEDIMKTHL